MVNFGICPVFLAIWEGLYRKGSCVTLSKVKTKSSPTSPKQLENLFAIGFCQLEKDFVKGIVPFWVRQGIMLCLWNFIMGEV